MSNAFAWLYGTSHGMYYGIGRAAAHSNEWFPQTVTESGWQSVRTRQSTNGIIDSLTGSSLEAAADTL